MAAGHSVAHCGYNGLDCENQEVLQYTHQPTLHTCNWLFGRLLGRKNRFFLGQTACHLTVYNSFKVGNNATPIGCLVGFTPSLFGDFGGYRIIWSLFCLFHKKSGPANSSLSPGTKKNNRRLVCMAHKHLGNTDLSTHLYLKHAICAAQHHPAFCVR